MDIADGIVSASIVSSSINKLSQKIENLDKQNFTLQKRLYWLTIATTVLAFIQTVVIVTQIFY